MNMVKDFSPVNIQDRKDLGLKPGDTVKVHQRIQEKDKTRIQVFEGIVLSVKHGQEPGATFTVRRTTGGVGVERIYPLFSPMIDKIEIVKRAKVRRAKLYYIREKVAREIRRQMRRAKIENISSLSATEEAERLKREAEEAEAKAKEAEEAAAKAEAEKAEAEKKEAEAKAEKEKADAEDTKEEPAQAEEEETSKETNEKTDENTKENTEEEEVKEEK